MKINEDGEFLFQRSWCIFFIFLLVYRCFNEKNKGKKVVYNINVWAPCQQCRELKIHHS